MRLVLVYAIALVVLLAPGLVFSRYGLLDKRPDAPRRLAGAILVACLLAYAAFWIYFLTPIRGRLFSVATYTLCAALGTRQMLGARRGRMPDRQLLSVLLLMLVGGLLYLSLLSLYVDSRGLTIVAEYRFFSSALPPDNQIPFLFARNLSLGIDPRVLLPPWHSSDRPPLQAGFILLLWPLVARVEPKDVAYQAVATGLQLFWIPAVWYLSRVLGASAGATRTMFLVLLFSGFAFLNSVFAWPKLLAGSLGVLACCYLLDRGSGSLVRRLTLASVAFALALLAHGGAAFTLPAILVCAWAALKEHPSNQRRATAALVGLAAFLALVAPWMAYQHFYDPPGDQVLKANLAGVDPPDPRPLMTALSDAYRSLSFGDLVQSKWRNVTTLFSQWTTDIWDSSDAWRHAEFRFLIRALGLLNISWLLLPGFRANAQQDVATARRLIAWGITLSLMFWIGAMFTPGTTIVHLGSYATVLMLFVVLALPLSRLSRPAQWALIAAQVLSFVVVWVLTAPTGRSWWDGAAVNPGMAVTAMASGAGLILIAARGVFSSAPEQ